MLRISTLCRGNSVSSQRLTRSEGLKHFKSSNSPLSKLGSLSASPVSKWNSLSSVSLSNRSFSSSKSWKNDSKAENPSVIPPLSSSPSPSSSPLPSASSETVSSVPNSPPSPFVEETAGQLLPTESAVPLHSQMAELESTLELLAADPVSAKVNTVGDPTLWLSPFFDAIGIHPVDYMQHFLGLIHEFTGAPWWLEIIGLTVFSRLAFMPLFAQNLKNGIRMANLSPKIKDISNRMAATSDLQTKLKIREEMGRVWKDNGIKPTQSMINAAKQMPIFLIFFFALRDPTFAPSMAYEGALWFPNLMLTDYTKVLPLINSLGLWASIEAGADNPSVANNKWMSRGIAAVGGTFLFWIAQVFPASVLLYWCTSAWAGVGITFLIKKTRLREYFQIPAYIDHSSIAPVVKPQIVYDSRPNTSVQHSEKKPEAPIASNSQTYVPPSVPKGKKKKGKK